MNAPFYTPDMLMLATTLVEWPWDDALPLQKTVRSRSCGSTLDLGLKVNRAGAISRLGVRANACAVGQASAAIFARYAIGRNAAEITSATSSIQDWLLGQGQLPPLPGFEILARAQDYPARHNALMLAWIAARDLLADYQVKTGQS